MIQRDSSIGWKVMAGVGILIALISLGTSIFLMSSRKSEEKPKEAAPKGNDELERLKQALRDRDKEVGALREQVAKLEDPTKYEKYKTRIEELEVEVRKQSELYAVELSTRRQLAEKVREYETGKPLTPVAETPKVEKEKSLPDLVEKAMPSVGVVRTDIGAGAGFYIDKEGYFITNYHVITGSRTISVETLSGPPNARRKSSCMATAYAVDIKNDLALLKVVLSNPIVPLELETTGGARVGDPVFAIGNPGVGNALLEMSVSNGILSSLSRQIEDRRFLQTTTPINPGNSGGPLLAMSGKVVGVVTAKATDKENIGFAVPAECVAQLFQQRETSFRINGTLADWEAKSGLSSKIKFDPARSIPIQANIAGMLVDEDNDRVLGLEYESNSLIIASISKKKVLQKVFTGSEPHDLMPAMGTTKQVWVANQGASNIVRIDLEKNAIVETLNLTFPPVTVLPTKKGIWCQDSTGTLHWYSALDKKDFAWVGYAMSGMAYDSRKDRILGVGINSLLEIDPGKLSTYLKEMAAIKPTDIRQRQLLMQEANKVFRNVQVPSVGSGLMAPAFGLVLDEKNSKVYYRRTALRLDKLETPLGVLKPNPYSLSSDPMVRMFMNRLPWLDEIMAVSPDGKWVANGTHIFSAERFTVQKEIPLPTGQVAFSKDSKSLFYFDWVNKVVSTVDVENK